jgi:aldehyde dehydrogenase (NAD+)
MIQGLFEQQQKYRWVAKQSSIGERLEYLRRLQKAIRDQQPQIIEALAADFQKPEFETLLTEIHPVLTELKLLIKNLKSWAKPQRVASDFLLAGTRSEIRREGRGCVLVIAPWNYPFYLAMVPLLTALAAGNTVILKPSEMTPATSELVAKMVKDLFRPELAAVVQGGADVSQELLKLPFDHIFFTGSTRVGKLVMKAAAENLSSVTLELGGKSPTIVTARAQIEMAAKKIVWGKLVNSGQTCVAPDFVFVEKSIQEPFCELLKKEISEQWGGALKAQIITDKHRDRLVQLAKESRGQTLDIKNSENIDVRKLVPQIIVNPARDSALMNEEIFGPVLPILTYQDLSEPIEFIRSRPKPLALYIFSEDSNEIERILEQTSAGGVCVNDTLIHLANPNLPFGGVGESGIGSYHGESGFRNLTHEKAVLYQGPLRKLISLFYPPYTKQKLKLFRSLVGLG